MEQQPTTSTTSTSPTTEQTEELYPEDYPDLDESAFLPRSTGLPGGVAGTFEDVFPNTGPVGGVRQRAVDIGQALKGIPFRHGGEDPDAGFDGPGFTHYVMNQLGVPLPKEIHDQVAFGEQVPVEQLQQGDLVAWQNSRRAGGGPHVAIYLGDGQILEAPRPGMGVRVRELDPEEGAVGVALDY